MTKRVPGYSAEVRARAVRIGADGMLVKFGS